MTTSLTTPDALDRPVGDAGLTPAGPTIVRKPKASEVAKAFAGRAFHPGQLWRAAQLQRNRKRDSRSRDDDQLRMFSEMLPDDFLHFGFFEDLGRAPEDMSLNDVVAAQRRYAERVLEHVTDRRSPVLDVGCGMGGLCRMLLERGHHPVAVTPDRLQARYVAQKYPDVPVINSKFEEILGDAHAGKFGTVITAESLQYLKLHRALPLIEQVLKPGGRWVACDYFYREPTHEKSCHHWDHFTTKLAEAGLRIVHRQDITANVLPTLRFAHMWATRFGVPAMRFAFFRFRKKQPGLHHLLHEVLALLEQWAGQGVSMVDAQRFEQKHQYMLVVVERAAVAERASSAPVLADTTFEFDLKPAKV